MNFVLFDRRELNTDGLFVLEGDRARHLVELLRVAPGSSIRTVELGAGRGTAEVVQVGQGRVTLRPLLGAVSAPAALDVTLIVALCRPQSVKKILEVAGTMGIPRVRFVNAERVERSFFSSSVLHDEVLEHHVRLGMEQGGTSMLPDVQVLESFCPATLAWRGPAGERMSARFSDLCGADCRRLLLHPDTGGTQTCATVVEALADAGLRRTGSRRWCVVIGPEGGWTDDEVAALRGAGCEPYSLGYPVVRVETAVTMVLAQLALLRQVVDSH